MVFIEPDHVIANSTSITKLICTKKFDDQQGFGITTAPIISSDNLKIHENLRNPTTIEIIIDSYGYIGTFQLICSSINNPSIGVLADIIIGSK